MTQGSKEPTLAGPAWLTLIAAEWLQQCGPCDAGLPMGCACPDKDPRPVIASLVEHVERLERRFPCDAGCFDAPEEECSRHGRTPAELWAIVESVQSQREAVRHWTERGRTLWCAECEGPSDVTEESEEQIGVEEQARRVWVVRLDCGHEEVSEMRRP